MVAIVAMLVVAAIATILSVTVAALLVVSCSLSYATGPNLGYRRELQAMAEPIRLGVPTAAPLVFLAISRELARSLQRLTSLRDAIQMEQDRSKDQKQSAMAGRTREARTKRIKRPRWLTGEV